VGGIARRYVRPIDQNKERIEKAGGIGRGGAGGNKTGRGSSPKWGKGRQQFSGTGSPAERTTGGKRGKEDWVWKGENGLAGGTVLLKKSGGGMDEKGVPVGSLKSNREAAGGEGREPEGDALAPREGNFCIGDLEKAFGGPQ